MNPHGPTPFDYVLAGACFLVAVLMIVAAFALEVLGPTATRRRRARREQKRYLRTESRLRAAGILPNYTIEDPNRPGQRLAVNPYRVTSDPAYERRLGADWGGRWES